MTYNKPSNITYTQMCIWIDNNAYTEYCDDNLLYEYLYHLCNMLAHESKYFHKEEYYDDFSIFSASRAFLRLRNEKQFTVQSPLKQIKSILNYLKTVIYPYKVDFENEFFVANTPTNEIIYTDTFNLSAYIAEETNVFDRIDFQTSLESLPQIIKSHLSKIPRKNNSAEWDNIYISCLLTILNNITITRFETSDKTLDQVYDKLSTQAPILYHLDSNMTNYIRTLVAELQHIIAKELTFETHEFQSADSVVKSLIVNSMEASE